MIEERKEWPEYDPGEIEPKWQETWERTKLYHVRESSDKEKYYCLDFFPYPSGDGLHVGHCRNYIPTDVISRYKRMNGFNVLHPMGWDAFGEPAEQHAIEYGVHPRITTDQNTANYRRQMKIIGTSYDWSREIDSSKPDFYRWTQYFFLLLYQRKLAYRDVNWQWWCHRCRTTLSSHEVDAGTCWRGHSGVTKKEIPAWYFRITSYADELLSGLDEIDWPERIKVMQRNWIGRSEGCEIVFQMEDGSPVPVFTTRPDTIYGVTFFMLAPEHEMVDKVTTPDNARRVQDYCQKASEQSEIERVSETREKTGVFTGGYIVNPINQNRVHVWVGDYVLPGYGTGAVMGVPAHDQRDYEFAREHDLPIKVVISPPDYDGEPLQQAYIGTGMMINSSPFNDQPNDIAGDKICDYLTEIGFGGPAISYRMRDWLISRQRYWGTPIPILYCDECGEVPVPADQLPVLLPAMDNFQPEQDGLSPLARVPEFVNTTCPNCNRPARRETDTMGGFACSSWYFLRFTSPHYNEGPFEPSAMNYWMPVDLYVGGAEHAVLHLLYSRFWTKVLYDVGLLPFKEQFSKLLNQGQLIAPDGHRMSKSRRNVITPDEIVNTYGADTLRIYELFMAPFEQDINWSMDAIIGARRFLNRIWKLFADTYYQSASEYGEDINLDRERNKTIKVVSERIEDFRFNTMVSALMEYVNFLYDRYKNGKWRTTTFNRSLEALIVLLAPAAPHMADELWQLTGHQGSVHEQLWATWDDALVKDDVVQIAVQVDGKLRDIIDIPVHSDEEYVKKIAFETPVIQKHIKDKRINRVYYIPAKVINIVTE